MVISREIWRSRPDSAEREEERNQQLLSAIGGIGTSAQPMLSSICSASAYRHAAIKTKSQACTSINTLSWLLEHFHFSITHVNLDIKPLQPPLIPLPRLLLARGKDSL